MFLKMYTLSLFEPWIKIASTSELFDAWQLLVLAIWIKHNTSSVM